MIFGSFWHTFGYFGNSSQLDNILKKDNLQIEEIMDEENIIQEIKSNQTKFTEYLIKNPIQIKKLVDYVTKEPEIQINADQQTSTKGFKYPYIASEIFSIQSQEVFNYLFEIKSDESNQENSSITEKQYDNDSYPIQKDDENKVNNNKEPENINQNQQKENQGQTTEPIETLDLDPQHQEQEPIQEKKNAESEAPKEQKEDAKKNEENKEPDQQETQNVDILNPEQKQESTIGFDKLQSCLMSQPEVPQQDASLSGKNLLKLLFTYLDANKLENMTLAGYFQKAVSSLISKSGQLWNFIKQYSQIQANLLKLIQVKAITDIIAKLITIDGSENKKYNNFEAEKKSLLSEIFEKYLTTDDEETLDSISMIFTEVMQTIVNSDKNPGKFFESIAEEIYKPERLRKLIQILDTQDIFSCKLNSTATILNSIVIYFQSKSQKQTFNEDNQDTEDQVELGEDSDQLEEFVASLSLIKNIIKISTGSNLLYNTFIGTKIEPFGVARTKIVELFSNMIKCKNEKLQKSIYESNIIQCLIDLIFKYEWNDILRNIIERTFQYILENDSNYLLQALFKDDYLIEAFWKYTETKTNQPGNYKKSVVKGYFAHVIKIANNIVKSNKSTQITQITDKNAKYKQFNEKVVNPANQVYEQVLGEDPRKKQQDEFDEGPQMEADIQRIYQNNNIFFQKFHSYFGKQMTDSNNKEEEQQNEIADDQEAQDAEEKENNYDNLQQQQQGDEKHANENEGEQLKEQQGESRNDNSENTEEITKFCEELNAAELNNDKKEQKLNAEQNEQDEIAKQARDKVSMQNQGELKQEDLIQEQPKQDEEAKQKEQKQEEKKQTNENEAELEGYTSTTKFWSQNTQLLVQIDQDLQDLMQ